MSNNIITLSAVSSSCVYTHLNVNLFHVFRKKREIVRLYTDIFIRCRYEFLYNYWLFFNKMSIKLSRIIICFRFVLSLRTHTHTAYIRRVLQHLNLIYCFIKRVMLIDCLFSSFIYRSRVRWYDKLNACTRPCDSVHARER